MPARGHARARSRAGRQEPPRQARRRRRGRAARRRRGGAPPARRRPRRDRLGIGRRRARPARRGVPHRAGLLGEGRAHQLLPVSATDGAGAEAVGARARASQRLRAKLGFAVPGLVAASRRLNDDPRVRDLYPEYLVVSHGVIRASVPLMEAARDRALTMAGSDAVAAGLAAYLAEHIPEERGHDEWLIDDLAVLGHERADAVGPAPSPTVAAVVGAQYYWILHHHPIAVLGYIAVLEGYPPSKELIEELIARTGHPRKAFRTILAHGVLDPRHRDELDAAIDALPLNPSHEALIAMSALWSARMLARML